METLRAGDLRKGDVLLFHGNGLLSKFIRLFDGSQYSHAAIFDGTKVVEAEAVAGNGIEYNDVAKSCASAAFTHVYRFVNNERQILDLDLPYDPVGTVVSNFLSAPEQYAYSQIVLLGLLLGTRRVPIPGIAPILRNFLDEAAEALNKMINGKRQVIICSELVYKCFYDTNNASYGIEVAGVDPNVVPQHLAPRVELMPSIKPDTDDGHFSKDVAAFMSTYRLSRGMQAVAKVVSDAATQAAEFFGPHAVPEFVTPRDLATSPNLVLAGQLVP